MATKSASNKTNTSPDRNPDPITGAPGAHPVGVGVGAAVGGAAAGATAGLIAGPVGVVAGAIAGGVAGGYAGKVAAESIDPTVEDAYWQENYRTRPYYDEGHDYDQYGPAYRYGCEARQRHPDRRFEDLESDLERGWGRAQSTSRLSWAEAKYAARDAWDRVKGTAPPDDHK
jgi:hypothetical protein